MRTLGTFTDEELAAVGSDGEVAARLAGPHVLHGLAEEPLAAALSAALRSLVARGLAEVGEVAADGDGDVTLGGDLARLVTLRRVPERLVLAERWGAEPGRAVVYGHAGGVVLLESIREPGYHDFTELDTQGAVAALARIVDPAGAAAPESDGRAGPPALDDVLAQARSLTHLRTLARDTERTVTESSMHVVATAGGVWGVDGHPGEAAGPPRPLSAPGLRATLHDLLH